MRIPPFLPDGGTIGFLAPSFGCATEPYQSLFNHALEKFQAMGYQVKLGPNCYASSGFGISNTPENCGRELNESYVDPESDALISCGGGEMMCEVVPHMDFDAIQKAPPKWYMGFSDNTNFTFLSATLADTAAIYGPCAGSFGMEPWDPSLSDAFALLTGKEKQSHGYPLWQLESLRSEENPFAPYQLHKKTRYRKYDPVGRERGVIRMEGRLLGGCLDCLGNLLGTRFDQVAAFNRRYGSEGILWFIESCDLNVLDMRRTLWRMKNAGWFDCASGFLIGRPLHFGEEIMGLDQYEAVLTHLKSFGVPILMDLDFGHIPPMMPLVTGAHASVKCRYSRIEIAYREL